MLPPVNCVKREAVKHRQNGYGKRTGEGGGTETHRVTQIETEKERETEREQ